VKQINPEIKAATDGLNSLPKQSAKK